MILDILTVLFFISGFLLLCGLLDAFVERLRNGSFMVLTLLKRKGQGFE
jgi:hypothetical protein